MAEEKKCGTCKYWERYKESLSNSGYCKYEPLPFFVFVGAHDNYTHELDGSDCNAWQSKEVNVLDRVKEECERQIGFFDGQSYQGKLAQQILTILDQQENMK